MNERKGISKPTQMRFYVYHEDASDLGLYAPKFATREEADQKCKEWNREVGGHHVMEIETSLNKKATE